MSVKCVGCGTQLGDHMKFCINCGRPVEQTPVAEQTPVVEQLPVVASEPIIVFQPPVVEQIPMVEQAPVVVVQTPVVEQAPVAAQAPVVEQAPVAVQAPVVEQIPTAVQAPVKRKSGRTVGSVLLSILLTLLLLVFGIYTSVALSVRHIVSLDSLTEIFGEISVADIRVNYFVGGEDEVLLPDFIHSQLRGRYASEISVRSLKKLVDADFIKVFLAELLYGYVADIFGEEGSGIISAERLEEFFEENYREINEILDCNIKYAGYEYVVEYLDEEFEIEEEYDFAAVREGNEEVLNYIALAGSYIVLYICAGLCILYALLILIVNRGRAGSWVTVGISSLLLGGVHFAGFFLLPMLEEQIEKSNALGSNIVEVIFDFVRDHLLLVGASFAGVFALMIVVAIIVNAISKAVRRRAARAA